MTKEEREEAGIVDLPATLAQALVTLQSNEVISNALEITYLSTSSKRKKLSGISSVRKFTNGNAINICLFTKEEP